MEWTQRNKSYLKTGCRIYPESSSGDRKKVKTGKALCKWMLD